MRDIRDMEDFAKSQNALEEIYTERRRQVDSKGYGDAHDDNYKRGELERAAAAYAVAGIDVAAGSTSHVLWPWERIYWKPRSRRENLIRAGALIVAAIERLDRAESEHAT